MLGGRLAERQVGEVDGSGHRQRRVDLVGDHGDVVLGGEGRDRLELSAAERRPGRVVRVTEQVDASAVSEGPLERVEVEPRSRPRSTAGAPRRPAARSSS